MRTAKFRNGKKVIIKNTLLYNGREGVIEDPLVRELNNFWDHNVRLDDGHLIGVDNSQLILADQ